MGYTHYWSVKNRISPEKWEKIVKDSRELISICKVPVQYEYDDYRPPVLGKTVIRFNGVESDGHETFLLKKASQSFEFCKTARKPYDLTVCCILLAAVHHAPENVTISSDGDWDDEWKTARETVKKFGIEFQSCPFNKGSE